MSIKRVIKNRTRSAGVMPSSYDADEHSIVIVYSSGARVDLGSYIEELPVSSESIDTSRIDAGVVNLLVEHNTMSKPAGRVVETWIEDGQAFAKVMLSRSKDPEVAGVVGDLIDGIRNGISVGYDILEVEMEEEAGRIIQRVTRWMPTEISIVNVPADIRSSVRSKPTTPKKRSLKEKIMAIQPKSAGAKSRSKPKAGTRATEEEVLDEIEGAVDTVDTAVEELVDLSAALDEVEDADDAEAVNADLAAAVETLTNTVAALTTVATDTDEVEGDDAEASAERGKRGERSRITGILQMATRHKMGGSFATRHIKSGTSLDEVRMQILEARSERSPGVISGARSQILRDETDTKRKQATRRIVDKLKGVNSGEEAGQFKRARMVDLARASMSSVRGVADMHDRDVIAHAVRAAATPGMHSSADFGFTNSIGDAMRQTLKEFRQNRVRNWEPLTSRVTVPDFREIQMISAGSGMNLRQIPEGGEVEFTTLSTEAGSMKIFEHAVGFAITFQALINDNLGIVNQKVKDAASMEFKLERKLFWDALLNNGPLPDGRPAFDASLGNMMTAELSVGAWADAVRLMSLQEDMDGEEMDLEAFALVVNPIDFATAKGIFAPIQATKVEDYNIFAGVEPLIIASNKMPEGSWLVAASPNDADSVATAYLEGYEGVEITEVYQPTVNGLSYIARAYAGAKKTGRRGYVFSTGTGA